MARKRMLAANSTGEKHQLSGRIGVEPESMVQQAYWRLEEKIVTLQLAPGQVVSEMMLAKLLDTGRTPVREAFQRLAREGLVNIYPKRGIIVSEMDVRKQLRLLEMRRYNERCVVCAATRRATDSERKRFAALADDMDKAARANDGENVPSPGLRV